VGVWVRRVALERADRRVLLRKAVQLSEDAGDGGDEGDEGCRSAGRVLGECSVSGPRVAPVWVPCRGVKTEVALRRECRRGVFTADREGSVLEVRSVVGRGREARLSVLGAGRCGHGRRRRRGEVQVGDGGNL
jgi:hypothetical protein